MAPVSATRKLSSGTPPTATQRTSGAADWLMASRPQGKAYGHRSRSASTLTHQPATAAGQKGSSSSSRWPDGEHGEDDRLGPGQPEPRVPGHVAQPGQQRHEQGQAEHQPAAERPPQAPPGQREHQQPRAQPPPAARRPAAGTRRRPPARPPGQQQRPPRAEPAERPGASGPRPGSGHGLGDHARSLWNASATGQGVLYRTKVAIRWAIVRIANASVGGRALAVPAFLR